MSELRDDTNLYSDVELRVRQHVSSVCRLCELRVERIYTLKIMPVGRLSIYCPACFDFLLERAESHIHIPKPEVRKPARLNIPQYLIKNEDPLRMFYPDDPIDLGLYRQRMRNKPPPA